MGSDIGTPEWRDLPPDRQDARRRHLLAEIEREPRLFRAHRSKVLLAGVLALVVAAAVGGYAATRAGGGQPGSTVPANLVNADVSAAGYAGENVWAVTQRGLELSPGSGWRNVTPPAVQPGDIASAYFEDGSSGWVAAYGAAQAGGASPLLVYHTTDGGSSWQGVTVDTSPRFANGQPTWIVFANQSDGWLEAQTVSSSNFSNANLYRTTDGGATWTALAVPIAGPITFTSSEDGFISGGPAEDQLYATHDGGTSWQAVNLPSSSGGTVFGPVFATPSTGVVSFTTPGANGTTNANVYETTDAGTTWTGPQTVSVAGDHGEAAAVVAADNDGDWFAALPDGTFATASGPGVTPTSQGVSGLPGPSVGGVRQVEFAGSQDGLALVGGDVCEGFKSGCVEYQALYTTADGGSSWTQLTP